MKANGHRRVVGDRPNRKRFIKEQLVLPTFRPLGLLTHLCENEINGKMLWVVRITERGCQKGSSFVLDCVPSGDKLKHDRKPFMGNREKDKELRQSRGQLK